MKIVLLMAGSSEAFESEGYLFPKSLVEMDGASIIQHVIESLSPLLKRGDQLIAQVQSDDIARFHIDNVVRLLVPDATVVAIPGNTAGAACTALLAVEHIQDNEGLLIVNGDQLVESDLSAAIHNFNAMQLDGGIVVFRDVHPRWSFVKCDEAGLVIEAAEKRPISNFATAGVYYFQRGIDFMNAAYDMIRKDAQVGGKFFVCPVYNEMILKQKRIGVCQIPKSAYWSLANPQGVRAYEEHRRTRRVEAPPVQLEVSLQK